MREVVPFIVAVLALAGCIIAMQNGIHVDGNDGLFCLMLYLVWRLRPQGKGLKRWRLR